MFPESKTGLEKLNGKIARILKIGGYVYENDVVQDRTTSPPQSSELPLQEKSLLQKTSQSSSSLPEIKIPTIIDRTAENSNNTRIGNTYLAKKSEAYPAATETINNSPSRFAKKSRLPFVQNIFNIFKISVSEVISDVKQNVYKAGLKKLHEKVDRILKISDVDILGDTAQSRTISLLLMPLLRMLSTQTCYVSFLLFLSAKYIPNRNEVTVQMIKSIFSQVVNFPNTPLAMPAARNIWNTVINALPNASTLLSVNNI